MEKKPRQFRRQGEHAEIMFMLKAFTLGFSVSKPYGESDRCDFIVDGDCGLRRVQVKSVADVFRKGADYRVTVCTGHNRRRYTAKEIDAVAAYIIPENLWYIVPPKE